jgi:ATP-dependent exoDNAse (exonuclease V) beta subunit
MKQEMKCSIDKSVVFDSVSHTYTKNGKKLISVTTFINQFKNKFDSDYHSKRIAKKENKTQEEILKLWSDKAKKSCEIGTAIHKIFEDYIDGKFSVISNEIEIDFMDLDIEYLIDFYPKSKVAIQFIKDFFISGRLTPVYTEYIVHNDFLAGQVDLICKDKDNNYYILDFKTNDKIETFSYNKKMLGVFKDINDCNFYHYSLQLSIYKKMFDKDIKGLFIIHIKPNKYDFIECIDIFHNYNIDFNSILTHSK